MTNRLGAALPLSSMGLANGTPFIGIFTFEEISKGIDDTLAQTE